MSKVQNKFMIGTNATQHILSAQDVWYMKCTQGV